VSLPKRIIASSSHKKLLCKKVKRQIFSNARKNQADFNGLFLAFIGTKRAIHCSFVGVTLYPLPE